MKSQPAQKMESPLSGRRMADSYFRMLIPLEKDEEMRNKYLSLSGSVRFGKLLEVRFLKRAGGKFIAGFRKFFKRNVSGVTFMRKNDFLG